MTGNSHPFVTRQKRWFFARAFFENPLTLPVGCARLALAGNTAESNIRLLSFPRPCDKFWAEKVDTGWHMDTKKDFYRSSRLFYIIAAAVEYFISILVGTTYLAKLATQIGLDDGTIGVITSFLALGCGFQIVAVLFPSDMRKKRLVLLLNLFNQLCFASLYIIPLLPLDGAPRRALFISLLLAGHILINICFSPKAVWSREIVAENKRGRFSATCEITSLISGMIFTFAMGRTVDIFEERGDIRTAFIILGAVLFLLVAVHAVMILLMKERRQEITRPNDGGMSRSLRRVFTDRATLTILPLFILWYVTLYSTTPFFGTYQLEELGFTMTAASVISIAYAAVRSIVSRPIGALGDRRSFRLTMSIGFITIAVGFVFLCFLGRVGYIIYYLLYAITLAATNSGQINIIFEYVAPENRSSAVAILYTAGGISGFLATLAMRPLVNHIQAQGNVFLGIEGVYAQQVLALIGVVFALLSLAYLNLVVRRLPRPDKRLLNETVDTNASV